jgi:hypothetical protein
MVDRRWAAWGHAVETVERAARASNDEGALAWTLHQQGTRDACLGHCEQGVEKLREALALRDKLGDSSGAASTRHNLAVLTRRGRWARIRQRFDELTLRSRPAARLG